MSASKSGLGGRSMARVSQAQLAAARGRRISDVVAPGLDILFCGINPSLYSAAVGHHFARPGNRFWKVLYLAGFTEWQLAPEEEAELLEYGLGITNLVPVATAKSQERSLEELRRGAQALEATVCRYQPRVVAVVGMDAYRKLLDDPERRWGASPIASRAHCCGSFPTPVGFKRATSSRTSWRLSSRYGEQAVTLRVRAGGPGVGR